MPYNLQIRCREFQIAEKQRHVPMSLWGGSCFTINEFLIIIAAIVTAAATTTTATLHTTGWHLVHVPVAVVFQRVKNVLTVWLHQVCPRLPQRVNHVVYEADLSHRNVGEYLHTVSMDITRKSSCHVWLMFISFFPLPTYRFRYYYFVCVIGGQHDGHLPFWLPGFVKFIMLKLYVLFAVLI